MPPALGAAAGSAVTLAPPRAARCGAPRFRLAPAAAASHRSPLLPHRRLAPGRRSAPLRVRATSDPNKERVRERVNKIEEEINRQARN